MTPAAPFSDLIEMADHTLDMNRRILARSDGLREQLNAILLTYRPHRFPQITGASDTGIEDRVRQLLRDFVSRTEPLKSFVGFSRGSICQACSNIIKYGAVEYDVVAGTSEMRLDVDCYNVFLDESGRVASEDSPDAA